MGSRGLTSPPPPTPPPPPPAPPQPPSHPPQHPSPLCHPRSRFLSLPLCGACPIVGYCGFLNKLLTPPKCRLRPGTLSSHRKKARRDHCYERDECLAARPHSCPDGDAERPNNRASGHFFGTNTFPVHQQHEATFGPSSCSLYAPVAPRRVEPTATRALPSPVSPASLKASPCIPRESHALRPQALYMRWHPTPVLGHTNRGLSCTEIPPRTMCGSGLSPDPADSLSHRLAYVRRSCRRNFRRSVAVAGAQKRSLGENHGTVLDVFPPNAVSLLPEPLLAKVSSPVKPEHWRYHTHRGTESGHETVPGRHWLVGEWRGVRWAAALPGAAGASVCPQSEAGPSGGANRLVMRRRTPLRQIAAVAHESGEKVSEKSRRWLVGEWRGVRWAAALPGAAAASVCPRSEAEPSGRANRLVMRRRTPPRQIAAVAHESGEKVSEKIVFHPPTPPSSTPPYVWRISHAKWNLGNFARGEGAHCTHSHTARTTDWCLGKCLRTQSTGVLALPRARCPLTVQKARTKTVMQAWFVGHFSLSSSLTMASVRPRPPLRTVMPSASVKCVATALACAWFRDVTSAFLIVSYR